MTVDIRPLTSADRPRVEEISAQIWDGDDYVPDVLDTWLADDSGEAVGAVIEGTLIAFARRTWLHPGHAWLEGIRTDPAYRGRGAGRAITEHLIEGARREGAKKIHLSTYIDNEASIHIVESYGFRRTASFAFLESDLPQTADPPPRVPIVEVDEAEATAFIACSDFLTIANGRFPRGWRFFPFDVAPQEATARLATRLGIRRDGALVALACVRQPVDGEGGVVLNFADGPLEDLRLLLHDVHRLYAGRHVETMVPKTACGEARLLQVLRELGYRTLDGYAAAVFVYEMPL